MPDQTIYRRRPVDVLTTVSRGQMRGSTAKAQADLRRMSPDFNYGLGVAKVMLVDYEEFLVTLRTVSGASQTYTRVPVPITFPGAGARWFLGGMPMVGDLAVIGWAAQESAEPGGGSKYPIILSWLIPGVVPGRDWATTADVEADEYDLDSVSDRLRTGGAYDRIRHKLRHIQPGNVVASSAQGSDLVLDEGVTLANRRGNEFRLRDQDQAAILRAVQKFDALAGARVYAGMVQRDATFLAPYMISDGHIWDGGTQAISGNALSDNELPADPSTSEGFLTPARLLSKQALSMEEGYQGRKLLGTDALLDPYVFLRHGGFINEDGFAVDRRVRPDVVYGGKPIYRVAAQKTGNSAADADAQTLTEYRIEVCHTSDGRLPVTEQTDMFDAERLPASDPTVAPGALPPNVPFIEWVLGSVVGNDPFSQAGRVKYGLPLQAVVFDGDTASPRLAAASIVVEGSGSASTPLKDQAATLFRLIPPGGDGPETFVVYNKQGQLRASIGGDPKGNSVEAALSGGLKLGIGGEFKLLLNGHFSLGTLSKGSLDLSAEEGPVRIFGGGPLKDQSDAVERTVGQGGTNKLPAVLVEGRTNVMVKAEKSVFLKGGEIEADATVVSLIGHEQVNVDGTKRVNISSENFQTSVNGKCQQSFSGPKYLLPTNGPLHERTYAPLYPGMTCEKVLFVMGDREEKFNLGSHKTTVLVGSLTYETNLGKWKARAVGSSLEMGASGISGTALLGTVSLTASSGGASMTGMTSASLVASGGQATVRGSTGVYLGGPITGPDAGPVICGGSLEPFTGLPFSTWGIGAKNHNVGA